MKHILSLLLLVGYVVAEDNTLDSHNISFSTTEGTWMSVDISPNAKTIAFDLLGHIYLIPTSGGKAKAITEGTSWNMFPRFSPDGKKILFTSDRSGSDDLWILNLSTGELTNISQMKIPVHQGTWSNDGRHVFGTALNMKVRHPVYMFNMYGDKQEIVPAGTRAPVTHFEMHPNNGLLYFEHGDGNLYKSGDRIKTYDTITGEINIYIDRPGGAANPRLSPDGKKLAYIHRDDRQTVLVIHDLQSKEEKIIARELDFDRQDSGSFYGSYPNMAWGPNGRKVIVSYRGGIHEINVSNGKVRNIEFEAVVDRDVKNTIRYKLEIPQKTAKSRSHRWSQKTPSGKLFESLGDLYLKSDSKLTNLTDSPAHETNPVYDPLSKSVFYASWNDKEMGAIYRMNLRGKNRKKLTKVKSQYGAITISPDGK
ncbi:MAG: hypothetical protein QF616_08950, partial [Candidatus Marinimicrobia bacterium]|nr:hypothetical protein [Candidatus Neomarinimicrobiota bacterium]